MEEKAPQFISTPVAVLAGSLIIAGAILISGGFINTDGFKKTGTVAGTATGEQAYDKSASIQRMAKLATGLGVDGNMFKTCVEGEKFKDEITKDISDASNEAGADGTPTFVIGKSAPGKINGVKTVGAQPVDVFKTILDEQLRNQPASTSSGELVTVSLDDDPVMGNSNAPVTMVEFSDYECPFCKRYFEQTYPQLKKDYIDTGKVKLVYRDLPLSFHEPAASVEANAANCVREQKGDEAYFKMHDLLFKNTKSNGVGV